METEEDLLLSIRWDLSLNAVVMMESDRKKAITEDLACAWVKVEKYQCCKNTHQNVVAAHASTC